MCGDIIQGMEFCDHFVLGKAKKVKFSQGKHTTTKPLEYIHLDVWGTLKKETHEGEKYFMSIIDDYSKNSLDLYIEIQG